MTGRRSDQVKVVRGRAGPSAGARTGHCPVRRGSRVPQRKQASRPARTARSLRSSAGCPPSRGQPGISAPRWTSAAPA